jgi:hypothetical protein
MGIGDAQCSKKSHGIIRIDSASGSHRSEIAERLGEWICVQ